MAFGVRIRPPATGEETALNDLRFDPIPLAVAHRETGPGERPLLSIAAELHAVARRETGPGERKGKGDATEPRRTAGIATIASCLLDEIFRTWPWLCRVGPYLPDSPGVLFTARPPELIALAAVPSGSEDSAPTIVYPEPLLSADEERLFRKISPGVRMQTLTDWLEERR